MKRANGTKRPLKIAGIAVQHNKLASANEARRKKDFWAKQLNRLQDYLKK